MEIIAPITTLILLIVFSLITVIYLGKLHFFFRYLKENEPEEWKRIGEPHLFLNNMPPNNIKLFKFLYKKEYLNLSNEKAIKKAEIIKHLLTTGLIIFPIAFVLIFLILIDV
jgi:hypothetical protein